MRLRLLYTITMYNEITSRSRISKLKIELYPLHMFIYIIYHALTVRYTVH